MKRKSIGINAFLNVLRSLLALIVPLVTYPYVSRTLGATNLGKVNYVQSIISYFVLFAGLGVSTYAVREGAKIRDKFESISKLVSECFTITFIMGIISYLILAVTIVSIPKFKSYQLLFIIQSSLIAFEIFGVEWTNTIFEDYIFITIRTIIVQATSIIAIILLIHNQDDYYIYTGIVIASAGIVSLLNWFHCRKKCKIRLSFSKSIRPHLKPIIVFFANKLAVTLYVNSDITMIGYIIGDYRVGIYSVAVKVYTIIKNLIAAVYAVTIPRLSRKVGEKDVEGYKQIFSKLCSFMTITIFPITLGLFLLSSNIILLLFGNEYIESGTSLKILSIGIIFAIYGGIVSSVYNVTHNLEKKTLQGTIIAAITNVAINLMLIPSLKEIGAAITTVLAEMLTFSYCLFNAKGIRKVIDKKMLKENILHASIGCVEILIISLLFRRIVKSNTAYIVFCIMFSGIIYGISLCFLKNIFMKTLINQIGSMFGKKEK